MPRIPEFKFYGSLPFQLAWNETAAVWELEVAEGAGPEGLPVVAADRYVPGREIFYFGHSKLKEVRLLLQKHLDNLCLRLVEQIDGLPEGPRIELIFAHMEIKASLNIPGQAVLTGRDALHSREPGFSGSASPRPEHF